MAIKFKCECGKALSAREIYAGRKVRCPKCSTKVRVPEPDEADEGGEKPKKRGAPRSLGEIEAEFLAGEDEEIVFSTKPGVGVLVLRLVLFNGVYACSVIAPSVVLIAFLNRMYLSFPGGTAGHMVLVTVGLIVGIILNALIWLTWQKSVYLLTPACIVSQAGLFFCCVQRMPLAKLGMIKQLRLGRGLAFYGS